MAQRAHTLAALVLAEAVSSTGTAMTFVALPWFVLSTTGSAPRMSVVLAVELAPTVIFGIPSGSLVARLGARTTMLLSDALRAPLVALVPVLYWTGHLSYPLLLAIVFLIGLFSAPYLASQRTIIPELFGDDEVTVSKASALFGTATQLPIVIGPALAGALVAWIGAPGVLLIDGATYLFAFAVVLVAVRGGRRVVQEGESAGVFAGLRYLARDRLLGPLTLTVVVLDCAAGAIAVAVPLVAYTRYGQNVHVAGWLFTSFGIGAVLGSVLTMKVLDRVPPLRLACVALVLATLPLWAIAAPISWPVACAAVVMCGVFVAMVNAPMMGLITTRPAVALRAKVLTAVMTASALGGPFGRLAVGPVFRLWGNAGVWIMIAGGLSLGTVLFIVAAVRGSAREPQPSGAMSPSI
ncbi:MAG TPA: MFS transporter [Gaiellaceae bacterium]|nr:MFS transporter [Gaiellaceae bacterium]